MPLEIQNVKLTCLRVGSSIWENPCCKGSLSIGVKCVAIGQMILSSLIILLVLFHKFMLHVGRDRNGKWMFQMEGSQVGNPWSQVQPAIFALSIITLTILRLVNYVFLWKGVQQRNPKIVSWTNKFMFLLEMPIFGYFWLVFREDEDVVKIGGGVNALFFLYSYWVVYSYARELKRGAVLDGDVGFQRVPSVNTV